MCRRCGSSKTHSHTSERLGYEAEKERQVKRQRKGAHPKRREKRQRKPPPGHLERGGAGRKRVDGKAKTQRSATTAARGGEAKLYHQKGEKSHSPVPQSAWQNYLERPPPRGGRSAGRKRNKHEKHIILCLNRAARLPRPWPGTEWGGRQDKTRRNTKTKQPKNSDKCPGPR